MARRRAVGELRERALLLLLLKELRRVRKLLERDTTNPEELREVYDDLTDDLDDDCEPE